MSLKKRGLGRGLDALIGAAGSDKRGDASDPAAAMDVRSMPVDLMQRGRYQPRRDFNAEALEELASSIRTQGLIQPIVVRPVSGGRFEIIAGERRWRAAQLAGLAEVPVVVRDVPDEATVVMSLIENIQREDLNIIEEAVALSRLQEEFGLTHEKIAEAVGKSRAAVSNTLRLLSLAPEVRAHLEARRLEMGHGRALLALPPEQQPGAAREVLGKGLSVRETEQLVRRLLNPPKRSGQKAATRDADVRKLEQELSETIGAGVAIDHRASGKGRLVIQYASLEQLDGLLGYFRR